MSHRLRHLIPLTAASLLALILSFAAPVTQAEQFSEYDLLLLDFTLDRDRLAQSVTAYTLNDTIVVSLAEAAAALEFPVEVDAANGTAKGWFLSKERSFALDINAGTVTTEGKRSHLEASDAIAHEDAIYVPVAVFSRWFPVNLTPDITSLTIKVEPREPLPVQRRAERRKLAGTRFIMSAASLPEMEMPYQLIGSHTADLALGYNIRRNTKIKPSSATTDINYSVLMRGELAYMNSTIYLSGNNTKTVSIARLNLSRDQPDTPKGISHFELGDTTPSVLPGGPQANIERGLLIKGSTFQDADLYNLDGTQTRISGNVLPGWEVELLHNGIRVDYQIIGTEGRYDFQNLELYSGANTFDLIFYGPAGERRTETVTRYAGADTIRKGNLSYQVTASQKGESLYEPELDPNSDLTDRGSGRYTARVDYGVRSNLSIRGGWNSLVENGERLNYYSAGFRTGWRDLYMTLDGTHDPLGGTIWDGAIYTPITMRLWGFNTQLQHTQYANTVLARDNTTSLQVTSLSAIVLSRARGKLSSRFAATHQELTLGSSSIYSADLSMNNGAHRIGNTLNYQSFNNPNIPNEPTEFTGNLYFNSKLNPLDIRGNILYQLQPQKKPIQYQLKVDLRVAQNMGMYGGLDYTPSTDLTLYTAGLNWQLKYISIAPRLSYDSNGNYTGFIYATTSLSPKPDRKGILISGQSLANNGNVASRVFVDHDSNGKFNAGDTPIPNADVYAPQAYRRATTDEDGIAYLTLLRPGTATDIQLDQDTLPEVAMTSLYSGNSIRPRPARWAVLDFPVLATGEIDGKLYRQQNNKLIPQPGMLVELRNANNDLVTFKVSGRDGFFLFEQVPLGKYTVTLTEESRGRLTSPPAKVILSQNSPTQQGVELVVSVPNTSQTTLFPRREAGAIAPAIQQTTPSLSDKAIEATPIPAQPTQTITTPYMLQLGAYSSKAKAEAAIAQLRQHYPKQLTGLEIQTERADLGTRGVFYRIYAIGTMDANEASARCQQFDQLGQSCIAVSQKKSTTH